MAWWVRMGWPPYGHLARDVFGRTSLRWPGIGCLGCRSKERGHDRDGTGSFRRANMAVVDREDGGEQWCGGLRQKQSP
eukprot:scaffold491013_cov25-Prasinocladus_malaysianus.AAC.1